MQLVARAFLSIVAFATALLLICPLRPKMPESGLDPSWQYAINEAAARGLTFGREVIFTFGPYGALYSKVYHPGIDTMIMGAGLFLAICMGLVATTLILHAPIWWSILLVYVMAGQMFHMDVALLSYAILMVVAAAAYLNVVLQTWEDALLVVLISAVGLLPLIKGSFIVVTLVSVFAIASLSVAHRRNGLAVIVVFSWVAAMTLFWNLAGQQLGDLSAYFSVIAEMTSGYTEAMAADGDLREVLLFLGAAAAIFWLVMAMDKRWKFKLPVLAALGAFLFTAFKGGFVRHDAHAFYAAGALAAAAVAVGFWGTRRERATPLLWLVVAAWFVINHAHMQSLPDLLYANFGRFYANGFAAASERLQGTSDLMNAMSRSSQSFVRRAISQRSRVRLTFTRITNPS